MLTSCSVTLLSILANDAIALPLAPSFPISELKYVMDNSQAKLLVASEKYAEKADELLKAGLDREPAFDVVKEIPPGGNVEVTGGDLRYEGSAADLSGGMMLYTSGTTNRPVCLCMYNCSCPCVLANPAKKGVLIPHSAISAQASSLIEAWKYSSQDRLLHLLPLHHIHGIVNAVLTPILAGSSVEFMFPFNPASVWNRLASPFLPETATKDKITFLTAVPTVYTRLMDRFTGLPPEVQKAARTAISPEHLRLNISGSAALPTPIKQAWKELSNGNVLLERYGMTETGMTISCGLDFVDRVDASVGWPLPKVEARLVDEQTNTVIEEGQEVDQATGRERIGEIQVRGPTIFREYWNNPDATTSSLAEDTDGRGRWFRTGDVASRRVVSEAGKGGSGEWARGPMYFIHGRQSVDIIKTGGEKVSALEVERELLSL